MTKRVSESVSFVALLRGINVGGKNLLPMAELARMFTAAGCQSVRTYIQSGNVIFTAAPELAGQLCKKIAKEIEKKFGFKAPVVVRSIHEVEEMVANNPFLKAGAPEDSLHVMFLAESPKAELVAKLAPKRSAPDEFIVHGREIFLKLPNGVARSKLTNAYFDSRLETVSTGRNWRTTLKLLELMKTR